MVAAETVGGHGKGGHETGRMRRRCPRPLIAELIGGLEHEFHDFPYIGNNHPN